MLTFLHVPHTGGRVLKRGLRFKKGINSVHNGTDIKNKSIHKIQYFILRPTVERIVGQVLHYSKNLKKMGQVNHLKMETLPNGYDMDNPFHFIKLEVNCNVYCKFILNRIDFSLPITENDFEELCILFKKDSSLCYNSEVTITRIWDSYEFPANLPNLEKTLNCKLDMPVFIQTAKEQHADLLKNVKFVEEIKKLNPYDIRLYKLLQSKPNPI